MPEIKARIEKAGNLIKIAAALVALLPSVAVLAGLVEIPPSLGTLIRFTCGSIGVVIVFAVVLLSDVIKRMSGTIAATLILLASVGGVAAATGYWMFARQHIIEQPDGDGDPIIIPLRPSAELRALLEPYGSDYSEAIATSIQRERINELLMDESAGSIAVMVALLLTGQSLIIAAFVLGAWKISEVDGAAHEDA